MASVRRLLFLAFLLERTQQHLAALKCKVFVRSGRQSPSLLSTRHSGEADNLAFRNTGLTRQFAAFHSSSKGGSVSHGFEQGSVYD
jgi:hypothetical protein